MLHFRFGKVYCQSPNISFTVGRESFFAGLHIQIVIWLRGYSLTVTTKKIYAAHKEKQAKFFAEIWDKRKVNGKHLEIVQEGEKI